jgi:hypothetical protein
MLLEEFKVIMETIFIFIEYVMNVDACAELELSVFVQDTSSL